MPYRSRPIFSLLLSVLASAALALASPARAQSVQSPIPAGSSPRAIAVNPITNKIYIASELSNSVVVVDGATNGTSSIPVGTRPQYIAVNPATDKVYVTSGSDSTLTVIDGATDTVSATLPLGSNGPIAINPVTNRIFVVRLSTAATDEVTIVDGNTNTWFTIAVDSFQPDAIAINPVTNKVYVATYATGDVRVVDGSTTADFPHPPAVPVWSTPVALAVNAATNRTYVVTQDSRGPFGYIDGATLAYKFFTAPGHASSPSAVAVNPVTNKVYAAFAGEVMVMDGGTDAFSFIPSGTSAAGPVAIGVNPSTNKIYVPNADGTLTVIDGATNAVTTLAIPAGATAVGVDPVTNRMYVTAPDSVSVVQGASSDTPQNVPLTTTITPLPGDTSGPNPSFTLNAASGFSPTAPPVRAVYFQLDATTGRWSAASGSGPYTASFSGLPPGPHTLYALATDTEEATSVNAGPQSVPLVGAISSYAFTVGLATASVSLASSANPSNAGQSVTFSATVSGSAGTPTGSVTFLDGSTAICSAVALSAGTAACATSSLTAGSHSITARYSGDASYNAATSGAVSQTV
ncbi:MAG TPA: Ig-like domain repeat protein, partial [Usitatibacter sp.]|nr:Ig-like domain repeat protein [Usitatibacter sp.]